MSGIISRIDVRIKPKNPLFRVSKTPFSAKILVKSKNKERVTSNCKLTASVFEL